MSRIKHLKEVALDTHVWVWAAAGQERARAPEDFRGVAYLPAIAIWDVGMLGGKGRLKLKPDLRIWVRNNLQAPANLEPIHPEIAILSTELLEFPGEPWTD